MNNRFGWSRKKTTAFCEVYIYGFFIAQRIQDIFEQGTRQVYFDVKNIEIIDNKSIKYRLLMGKCVIMMRAFCI